MDLIIRAQLILLTITLMGLCTGAVDVPELTEANSEFGFKLYSMIAGQEDAENIFFSPYSISTAFAMVYIGSKGQTKTEMGQVFGFKSENENSDLFKISYKSLIDTLFNENQADYTLKSANKFYGQDQYEFNSNFKVDLEQFFEAGAEEVDFARNAEAARTEINQWVEEQTENTIKDLFASGW